MSTVEGEDAAILAAASRRRSGGAACARYCWRVVTAQYTIVAIIVGLSVAAHRSAIW